MDYKANYGRRYYVESTAYDFDMFTDKKKSATNVVDFNEAKKNKTRSAHKKSLKSKPAHKVNMRTVSTVMVCLLFLGLFGINIFPRASPINKSAVSVKYCTVVSRYFVDNFS